MEIDLQVNGGNNLNFNDVKNLNDFLSIELAHIKKSKNLIAPTFITDDLSNLDDFIDIVNDRQKIEYLPKLKFIHLEGFFITNKGCHPEKFLLEINKNNLDKLYNIFVKLNDNINIIMTIAPELINIDNVRYLGDFKENLKKSNINLILNAGHTNINSEDFEKVINLLNDNNLKISGITHFHNAMLGGHFLKDEGIFKYLINNPNYIDYIELITDEYHTNKGDLLPSLLCFYDKIVLISDASCASCYNNKKQKLFNFGSHINVLTKQKNHLSCLSYIDFFKNKDDKLLLKEYIDNGGKIDDLYFNNKIGYKNLAGSAGNLRQCKKYLQNIDIVEEFKKTLKNNIALEYLIFGINKLYEDGIIYKKNFQKISKIFLNKDYSRNNLNYLKIHFKKIIKIIYSKYLKYGKFYDKNIKFNLNKVKIKKNNFIDYSTEFNKQNEEIKNNL